MRKTPNYIIELKENEIFVFGSNNEGHHFGGAAKLAHEKFGAAWGIGNGSTGLCYAIDTMSGINEIKKQINSFMNHVLSNSHKKFMVTEIGCGIAGFNQAEIAPLFKQFLILGNVYLPESFIKILDEI